MDYVYKNPRPRLIVKSRGGKKLGNCYSASYYTVTSTYPLSDAEFDALFASGAIGYGQVFYREPVVVRYEAIPCVGMEGNKVVDENPINPYSGKPYGSTKLPYWTYKVETRCDSGD